MLENLEILRKERNMSQQELASIINVSQQTITKYEKHQETPSIYTLMKLANVFDTSVDYLIGYTNIRTKPIATNEFDLNAQEAEHIITYRKLPTEKQLLLDEVTKVLSK